MQKERKFNYQCYHILLKEYVHWILNPLKEVRTYDLWSAHSMTPVLEERKCMTKVQKDLWSSILPHIDRTVWLYFSASLLPFQNLNFGFCLSTLLWCGEKGWFIYSSDFFHWLTRFICTKTIHDIRLIMQTRVFYCLRHRIGEREWVPGIEKLYWTQMNMIIFLFPLHPLDMHYAGLYESRWIFRRKNFSIMKI